MFREIKYYPIEYICKILLDNGTIISVLPDGTADGSDGNRYRCNSHIDDNGDTVVDGWVEVTTN